MSVCGAAWGGGSHGVIDRACGVPVTSGEGGNVAGRDAVGQGTRLVRVLVLEPGLGTRVFVLCFKLCI